MVFGTSGKQVICLFVCLCVCVLVRLFVCLFLSLLFVCLFVLLLVCLLAAGSATHRKQSSSRKSIINMTFTQNPTTEGFFMVSLYRSLQAFVTG